MRPRELLRVCTGQGSPRRGDSGLRGPLPGPWGPLRAPKKKHLGTIISSLAPLFSSLLLFSFLFSSVLFLSSLSSLLFSSLLFSSLLFSSLLFSSLLFSSL